MRSRTRQFGDGEGAVYNDFDFDTTSLLSEAGNLCSQTSVHTNDAPTTSMAPQDAVEFAILEADKSEGVLYEHTVFDHPLFDCETAVVDEEYIQKVYDIVCTDAWKYIKEQFSGGTESVYDMRYRNSWAGPDTIFDAWLLRSGKRRTWFPFKPFKRYYPDWKTSIYAERNGNHSEDDSEEETSESPEQHLAVKEGRLSHSNEVKLELFKGDGDDADENIALSIDDSDGEEEPEIKHELFQADDNEESGTIVLSSDEEIVKKEPGLFEVKCNVHDIIVIVSDSD